MVLAVLAAALGLFLALEAAGRRETVLVVVLGVLVLDVTLYPGYPGTTGLLQPTVLGHSIDLVTVLAVVALVARLPWAVDPVLRGAGGLWALFLVWTAVSAVSGLLQGHGSTAVLYEAEVVPHVAALALLAAGVAPARLAGRSGLPLLAWCTAPVALLAELGHSVRFSVSGLDTVTLGSMGADAATVYASLGVLALLLALAAPSGSRGDVLPALVLAAAPAAAGQRAALLGLAATAGVVLLALAALRGQRFLRAGRRGVALAAVCGVAVLALGAFVGAALQRGPTGGASVAGVEQLSHTFTSPAKQQSAQSRRNQWQVALGVAGRAPVLGGGLGTTYLHYEVGAESLVRSDITHDVPLDVALRSGLVGVALLLAATVASAREAVRALWSDAPAAVRVLALGGGAVLVGLVVRGSVESLLEKHRLAVLLGVVLGLITSAYAERVRLSTRHGDPRPGASPEPRSAAAWR